MAWGTDAPLSIRISKLNCHATILPGKNTFRYLSTLKTMKSHAKRTPYTKTASLLKTACKARHYLHSVTTSPC